MRAQSPVQTVSHLFIAVLQFLWFFSAIDASAQFENPPMPLPEASAAPTTLPNPSTPGTTPTSGKPCCLCQYQTHSDCNLMTDKGSCLSARVGPLRQQECAWVEDEGSCITVFEKECKDVVRQWNDQGSCSETGMIERKESFTSWYSANSCGSYRVYEHHGHGRGCFQLFSVVQACLKCEQSDVACNIVVTEFGCSTLSSIDKLPPLIERVRERLKELGGGTVVIQASQGLEPIDECVQMIAPLRIEITESGSQIGYPRCEPMIGSFCPFWGNPVRCRKDDGSTALLICDYDNFWKESISGLDCPAETEEIDFERLTSDRSNISCESAHMDAAIDIEAQRSDFSTRCSSAPGRFALESSAEYFPGPGPDSCQKLTNYPTTLYRQRYRVEMLCCKPKDPAALDSAEIEFRDSPKPFDSPNMDPDFVPQPPAP